MGKLSQIDLNAIRFLQMIAGVPTTISKPKGR